MLDVYIQMYASFHVILNLCSLLVFSSLISSHILFVERNSQLSKTFFLKFLKYYFGNLQPARSYLFLPNNIRSLDWPAYFCPFLILARFNFFFNELYIIIKDKNSNKNHVSLILSRLTINKYTQYT